MSFFNSSVDNTKVRKSPRRTPELTLASDNDKIFIFNDDANGGFVIIGGDERMPDVLAYSLESRFDPNNIPCNKEAWLKRYEGQVAYLWEHPEAKVKQLAADEDEVKPLLGNTAWHQTYPFNALCPESDVTGQPCPTGCVATAMAQIMYYYKLPQQTSQIIPGYTTEKLGIIMPDLPVTQIDWDNMLDQYIYEETQEQIDAISNLMLLCCTAVKADYGPLGTSAYDSDASNAFLKYFDYEVESELRPNYQWEDWEDMIFYELKQGRPVYYSGVFYDLDTDETYGGHAFVVDGYKDGFIHVNWGWGYVSDEYYEPTYVDGCLILDALVSIQPILPNSPREYAVLDNDKITFYYDTKRDSRSGNVIMAQRNCKGYEDIITECVIDSSFVNYYHRKMLPFFAGCKKLKSIKGLEYLNVKSSSLAGMFVGCSSLTNIDFSHFDTSGVTNMSGMFSECDSLKSLDLSNFDTSSVTDMGHMFSFCYSLENLDLSNFDTGNVTNMESMFNRDYSLKSLDLSNFNTGNVTDMGLMFANCSLLESLDLSNFNTGNVTNMKLMFQNDFLLKSLDISNFNTGNVIDMNYMFASCFSLDSLDLSSFDTNKVISMKGMFSECNHVKTIYVSEGWQTPDVDVNEEGYNSWFFSGNYRLVGGAGTSYYDIVETGATIAYAHVDGGPSNPGLLTYKENHSGIKQVYEDMTNACIYNIGGIKVRPASMGLEGLPAGVYIMGKKKYVVK